jgi:YVTN family beta-propeller protein
MTRQINTNFKVSCFNCHRGQTTPKLSPDLFTDTFPNGGYVGGGAPWHGIIVSPDNKTMWIDSSPACSVFPYSLPDPKLLGYVRVGAVPDWLAFTPDGKTLYVANSGSNSVSAIDASTHKELTRIPVGQVPKPNGMVVVPGV